jgi:hypothetical protein
MGQQRDSALISRNVCKDVRSLAVIPDGRSVCLQPIIHDGIRLVKRTLLCSADGVLQHFTGNLSLGSSGGESEKCPKAHLAPAGISNKCIASMIAQAERRSFPHRACGEGTDHKF